MKPFRLIYSIIFSSVLLSNSVAFAHKPTSASHIDGKYIFVSNKPPKIALQTDSVTYNLSEYARHIYVKTNAPAWLLLWVNAGFEIDIAPHWSFNVPIYYSGWNYFTSKLKFRTFSVVPEFRWWPRKDNMGFFLNAHLGLNQFNYAKGGDWRYQTWHGHSPALGGGIGLGYRWNFCKNHRWSMEAAVGAGVTTSITVFSKIFLTV